jgi:stage V sporulation protein B
MSSKENGTSKKNAATSFVKGAAILGLAGLVVKILGAFFRIPLGNFIGSEGMSYYQGAYAFFIQLSVVSTAGIPTAIAKIISERLALGNEKGANRVLKVSTYLMISVGIAASLLMFFGAPILAVKMGNAGSMYPMFALVPALFFISLMAVYRGYFQGRQMMQPYAISQVVEQFFRVVGGMTLALVFLGSGLQYAAAGAALGASIGSGAGFVCVFVMYKRFVKKNPQLATKGDDVEEPFVKILGEILLIAIPITIGASVMPVMGIADASIVIVRLQSIGMDNDTAKSLYGQLSGFAQSIVNLPQILTAAVQISIVPAIASFKIKGDRQGMSHAVETGLRLAMIIGLPCAVGIAMLSEPIIHLLYPLQPDVWVTAGKILGIYGWGIIFLSLYQITTGMIQGMGKPFLPALFLILGATIKVILTYILVAIPMLNVLGAAMSTIIAFALASILNVTFILTRKDVKINYNQVFIRPIVDVVVMGIVVVGSYNLLISIMPGRLSTVLAILIGGTVYIVMLFATNTITDDDLAIMPGGAKLNRLKNKLNLNKKRG